MSFGGRGGPSSDDMMMQGIMFKVMTQLSKNCFSECVNSFREDKLTASEIKCITSCSTKDATLLESMNDIQ